MSVRICGRLIAAPTVRSASGNRVISQKAPLAQGSLLAAKSIPTTNKDLDRLNQWRSRSSGLYYPRTETKERRQAATTAAQAPVNPSAAAFGRRHCRQGRTPGFHQGNPGFGYSSAAANARSLRLLIRRSGACRKRDGQQRRPRQPRTEREQRRGTDGAELRSGSHP